jgi:hypothetical protein
VKPAIPNTLHERHVEPVGEMRLAFPLDTGYARWHCALHRLRRGIHPVVVNTALGDECELTRCENVA